MKKLTWREIAEAVGIAAIVVSLIFVGMQMRQDRVHARAELGADSFAHLASIRLEMTSPEFAATLAKSIEHPDQLTTTERLQVNGYLEAYLYLVLRDCYLKIRGVFSECEIIVREYGPIFFGNEYAQAWWDLQDPKNTSFLPDWVDGAVRGIDPQTNLRELEALK